jgi:hypothetical protein
MEVTILKIIDYLKTLTQGNPALMNTVLDKIIINDARKLMKQQIKDRLFNDVDLLWDVVNLCKDEMPVSVYNEIIAYIETLKGN